jgi:hypothetical protein
MQLNRADVHPTRHLSDQNDWHIDCSVSIEKVYKATIMNLSMQIRRAFITLGLAATAMVLIAAKTSLGAAAHMQMPVDEPVRAETVSVAREKITPPSTFIPVRVVAPMLATKEHNVRKIARLRCERAMNG